MSKRGWMLVNISAAFNYRKKEEMIISKACDFSWLRRKQNNSGIRKRSAKKMSVGLTNRKINKGMRKCIREIKWD